VEGGEEEEEEQSGFLDEGEHERKEREKSTALGSGDKSVSHESWSHKDKTGPLVYWSTGPLVYWSTGLLVY